MEGCALSYPKVSPLSKTKGDIFDISHLGRRFWNEFTTPIPLPGYKLESIRNVPHQFQITVTLGGIHLIAVVRPPLDFRIFLWKMEPVIIGQFVIL